MRNRYQRDLNRLVKHPRRGQGSRKLRAPGALSGAFSAAAGLKREPAVLDLDIFILNDESSILRMSPDMTEVKETLVNDSDIKSFAIYDERYLYAQKDTGPGVITNYVRFDNGVSIATNWDPEVDQRDVVGVNQTHALVHFVDQSDQTDYIEKYDRDGNFVSRIASSGGGYSYGAQSFWVIPATGDYVFISSNGLPSTGDGSEQGWYRFNLSTGQKVSTINYAKFWGDFCTSDRYYCLVYNDQVVEIRDINMTLIGTLPLNRQYPTSFCVTHNKAYCFFGGSALQQCFVQIYARDGDSFTLEQEFDLNQTLGLRYIRAAMPDMKEVLGTNE